MKYLNVEAAREDVKKMNDDEKIEKMTSIIGEIVMLQLKAEDGNPEDVFELCDAMVLMAVITEEEK